jgi:tetratricopeptide (TPR) repeat protein
VAANAGSDGSGVLDESVAPRLHELSVGQLEELTANLTDQWHGLVKTDNLLGPRHALGGVRTHLAVLEGFLRITRPPLRQRVLLLAARYAESAAWLHEDSGDAPAARLWTGRAMEWAVEADDQFMMAWTLFRRSQQSMSGGEGAQVGELVAAARRQARGISGPALAAILQQEACAHALDGAETDCHRLMDRAHELAAADDGGDASGGHGSFCTSAYLEVQRGACWLILGRPDGAVTVLDEALKSLPTVYRRDRGVALSRRAVALAAAGEVVEAAMTGRKALEIAQDCGSGRIIQMILPMSAALAVHNGVEEVAALRAALAGHKAA